MADYPIWQLWIDGELAEANIAQNENGLVSILVPAGSHQLEIKLTNTNLRKFSNWLSLLGWFLVAVFIVEQIWRQPTHQSSKSTKSVTMKAHHEPKKR